MRLPESRLWGRNRSLPPRLVGVHPGAGGEEPSAAQMVAEAESELIDVICPQPEFSSLAAETIAQENAGEVLVRSPLGLARLHGVHGEAEHAPTS